MNHVVVLILVVATEQVILTVDTFKLHVRIVVTLNDFTATRGELAPIRNIMMVLVIGRLALLESFIAELGRLISSSECSHRIAANDFQVLSCEIHATDELNTPMEFSRLYLEKMFTEIMGFDAFYTVRIQGTQTQGVDISQAVKAGHAELTAAFSKFYQ